MDKTQQFFKKSSFICFVWPSRRTISMELNASKMSYGKTLKDKDNFQTYLVGLKKLLKLRQYKSGFVSRKRMIVLKLPPFFPCCVGQGKRAAISIQTRASQKRVPSYIVLALGHDMTVRTRFGTQFYLTVIFTNYSSRQMEPLGNIYLFYSILQKQDLTQILDADI